MGVLNVTPDSFSDGGRFVSTQAAVAQAQDMIGAGADLIDVGGESTRPGTLPVPSQEQIRRAACEAGAGLINDISAGRDDPAMLPLAAQHQLPIVLMHMQGTPQTMQANPVYSDVVAQVSAFLVERRNAAVNAGIAPSQILLDPGLGFGKTDAHNVALLRETSHLAAIGQPLVIGASRKGFVGRITGETDVHDRLMGTAAVVGWCAANGAGILRVHDVGAMFKVVQMVRAIVGNP